MNKWVSQTAAVFYVVFGAVWCDLEININVLIIEF